MDFVMSTHSGVEEIMCCAACGAAEADHIKLKKCTACYLVRYCSVKCQKEHRPQHKKECKKRAAELRDKILFKQPESSHEGDCPICCLPLSFDPKKSILTPCCSKFVCLGCEYANQLREMEEKLEKKCPFCRLPTPKLQEEADKSNMKRVEANDPVTRQEKEDNDGAFEYYTKAAGLGNVDANFDLALMYHEGKGVGKDKKKMWHHLEEAAICGHPKARHNLGCFEEENGRNDRAAKHYIIAANLGHEGSLQALKDCYREGYVSKDDFAAALRDIRLP